MTTHVAEIASLLTALNKIEINPAPTFDTETGHLKSIAIGETTYTNLITFAEKFRSTIGEDAKQVLENFDNKPPMNFDHESLGNSGTLLFATLSYGTATIDNAKVVSTHRDDSEFLFNLDNGWTVIVHLWAMNSNIDAQECVDVIRTNNH